MASDRESLSLGTLDDVHAELVGLYRVFEGRALAGDAEAGALCCDLLGSVADVLESMQRDTDKG